MDKIYEILANIRPEFDFKNAENYIEDGLLDSFDMVTLVSDLEAEFGIIIDGLDIIPENFADVNTIMATVKKNGGKI